MIYRRTLCRSLLAVEMYLQFACCAAVPGGGRNKEYALHLLHMCKGNIHVRTRRKKSFFFVSGECYPPVSFLGQSEKEICADIEAYQELVRKFFKRSKLRFNNGRTLEGTRDLR